MARVALQLPHAVELLALPERNRVPTGVLVRERDDRREAGSSGDVAAGSSRPREAIVFFDGIRRPLGSFVNRALTDHEAAGIADELAARVVAHEVLAPAFGTDPILLDDRICRRSGRHGTLPIVPGGNQYTEYNTFILYLVIVTSDTPRTSGRDGRKGRSS